ncbi:MAG: HAD-IA family hydrolase [Cyanophyceae cyanobacterium]
MTSLQALIFDVDGTMADTERDGHRVAFNRAFAEAGLDWEWSVKLYGKLLAISGGKERLHFYLRQYRPEFEPSEGEEQFVVRLHQIKSRYYQQILSQEGIPLRPGIRRILQEARSQEIRLAIATTASLPNVTPLVKFLAPDAVNWFEVIAAGDIVTAKKPAPDIYQYVLQEMKLAPQQCLVFEDSPHGLAAARQADLTTVVTVNDYTKTGDFTGAALVVDHLGEPEHPCTILAGDGGDRHYFNLALARHLID